MWRYLPLCPRRARSAAMDQVLRSFWPQSAKEAQEAAVIEALRSTFANGEWTFLPNYPLGHVQISGHQPWQASSLGAASAITCALLLVRQISAIVAPHVGKRLGVALHGASWLESAHGRKVDWHRFSDVAYFLVLHVALTAFAVIGLSHEIGGWFADPSQWWAFMQPALSDALHAYYILQIGVTCEASLSMLRSVSTGRTKDAPMMVHHAATLSVLLCAWRFGFARVGVAVVALHDASDIPIDLIRIAQAIEWEGLLYVGAASSVISWAALRAYAFPRYIISSALFATGHIWPTYSFVPHFYVYCGYTIYIVPLVLLWLLSCYWLTQLTQKLILTIRGAAASAPQVPLSGAARPGPKEAGRNVSRRSVATTATRIGVAIALRERIVRR